MKLLLRRSERAGLLGKLIFVLDVRAELSDEERDWIAKYKLGNANLYVKNPLPDNLDLRGMAGVGFAILHHALNITISVNDLKNGKRIECKDILEMLAAEEQLKDAARTFNRVLHAASQFDGEEVVAL